MSRRPRLAPAFALVLGLLLLAGAPLPASGQLTDLRHTFETLRGDGIGLLGGCDYVEYLNTIEDVRSGWGFLRDLHSGLKDARRHANPLKDYISNWFRERGVRATVVTAEAESRALLYQLEQVCNTQVQLDQINRTYRMLQEGNLTIGNALRWIWSLGQGEAEDGGALPAFDRERVEIEYARVFDTHHRPTSTLTDTLWTAVSETLHATLEAGNAYGEAMARIWEQIGELKAELVLVAEWDTEEGRWACPENYPDPNEVQLEADTRTGRPICGPASPERSIQILAQVEQVKSEIRALQTDGEARGLEVDAVRLMTDNHLRIVEQNRRIRVLHGW